MPLVNEIRNVNLAIDKRGIVGGCPNPSLNPVASCGENILPYTVLSFDDENNQWFPANSSGSFTFVSSSYGIITGSMNPTKVITNGCAYDALYFSGSATFDFTADDRILSTVSSGSITTRGNVSGQNWYLTLNAESSSFIFSIGNINYSTLIPASGIVADNLIGVRVRGNIGPVPRSAEIDTYVNGVKIETFSIAPLNPTIFGDTYVVSSDGCITRVQGNSIGSAEMKTQYDCLYGTS